MKTKETIYLAVLSGILGAALVSLVGCGRSLDAKACPTDYHSEFNGESYVCVVNNSAVVGPRVIKVVEQ